MQKKFHRAHKETAHTLEVFRYGIPTVNQNLPHLRGARFHIWHTPYIAFARSQTAQGWRYPVWLLSRLLPDVLHQLGDDFLGTYLQSVSVIHPRGSGVQ